MNVECVTDGWSPLFQYREHDIFYQIEKSELGSGDLRWAQANVPCQTRICHHAKIQNQRLKWIWFLYLSPEFKTTRRCRKGSFFQSFHRQTRAQEVIQLKHFPQHDLHNWHTMLTNTNPCGKSLGVLSVVPTLQHGINLWTSTVETRSFALKCSQCGVRGKILPHSVFLGQTSFHNVIQRSEHPTGSLRGVRARCFGDCN